MYMIMFILDDPQRVDELLAVWEQAGVSGATLVESSGLYRRRRQLIPMRYVFQTTGDYVEESHFTIFAIVEDDAIVQACLKATEALVGDLGLPNTGVFAAWPLSFVKGVPKQGVGR
ncbi:MAG: hypothetical protein QME21_14455 [Anaerolineales bacterium]|nr:hypothetical protein [Anaerolineales bacterium]